MGLVKDILAMPNDSQTKTVVVASMLCLVCSVVVSTVAVGLKPQQEANKALDKKRNILQIAGMLREGASIDELFNEIEPRLVDLDTGEFVDDIDPATYDQRKAAKDPAASRALSKDEDVASIRRREKLAAVYLVREEEELKTIILPMHGYGLWSTMYGFMALEGDGQTITGFGFYEHGETPGLGGEVDNPKWKALWPGKQVYTGAGDVGIELIKGTVSGSTPDAQYKVDGLAGATLTSRGVSNLLQYWLGDMGFRPFLNKLRQG
ncbi:MAG TPA: Na(+)-translocating NADH-quinone reductase subunit C [Gammaproteobacteria bacterium]|jgi:Na+-transporting NADH:ubiquinone oxidoreductase subunit C|nr:Na(+)-translocating NADH-quinone reductase subunit C [Gammaproteobacteria bacterium]